MNIVFFGSSDFALPTFKALLASRHTVSCVVTQPDRKKGRGLNLSGTAIKKATEEAGLKFYQPLHINSSEAIKLLKGLQPDLFVVIAYGQILPKAILEIPRIFSINIHASLLPEYRGAAPINWALINGKTGTGVTVIKMTEKMDSGPIIIQKRVDVSDKDTVVTLEERLSKIAAEFLLDALVLIENNSYKLTAQDESKVTFAPRLHKEDGLIHWDKPAQDIYNLIRGVLNWPGAFTYYSAKLLKIYRTKCIGVSGYQGIRPPGEIMQVSKDGIVVACGRDSLIITELQIEGSRRMTAEEFITGHRITVGEILGNKK